MDIVGLDRVQLAAPAGCEADARRLYRDVLGLPELQKPPYTEDGWGNRLELLSALE